MQAMVPVHPARHRDHRWRAAQTYGFAKGWASVPVARAEIEPLATCLPLLIAPDRTVHAVFAFADGPNLFVGPDGEWRAPKLPERLRLYPFAPGLLPDGRATAMLDETSELCGPNAPGIRLFKNETPTAELYSVLKRIEAMFEGQKRLQQVVERIAKADLLAPAPAPFDGWQIVAQSFPAHMQQFGPPAIGLFFAQRISLTNVAWLQQAAQIVSRPVQKEQPSPQDQVADFLTIISKRYAEDQ